MKSAQKGVSEICCGNCRHWFPWKAFAVKGVLSERRAVQKGAETGCDGKCCCYQSGMIIEPTDSSDTVSASHCKYYSSIER